MKRNSTRLALGLACGLLLAGSAGMAEASSHREAPAGRPAASRQDQGTLSSVLSYVRGLLGQEPVKAERQPVKVLRK